MIKLKSKTIYINEVAVDIDIEFNHKTRQDCSYQSEALNVPTAF